MGFRASTTLESEVRSAPTCQQQGRLFNMGIGYEYQLEELLAKPFEEAKRFALDNAHKYDDAGNTKRKHFWLELYLDVLTKHKRKVMR